MSHVTKTKINPYQDWYPEMKWLDGFPMYQVYSEGTQWYNEKHVEIKVPVVNQRDTSYWFSINDNLINYLIQNTEANK